MKTNEQIDAELAALKQMRPNVRRYSAFDDDNHAAIDAQLLVLRERMGMDEIYDTWGDEEADDFSQNILNSALSAQAWMMGEAVAPTEDWAPVVMGA